DRGDLPVAVAHRPGLGQEVGALAGVEALLTGLAARQELEAARVEAAVQLAEEGQRLGRQHFGRAAFDGNGDLSGAGEGGCVVGHAGPHLRKRKKAGAPAPTSQRYQLSGPRGASERPFGPNLSRL